MANEASLNNETNLFSPHKLIAISIPDPLLLAVELGA